MDNNCAIPEDVSRLCTFSSTAATIDSILDALRTDKVVLVREASAADADRLITGVTERFGIRNQLEVQSAFASMHGHRSNVGQHFMSVNKRADYQFIPAHSEGTHSSNMQLAAFYCYENTTDGGESILLNTNPDSPAWNQLRAHAKKIDLCGRKLSAAEVAAAKMMYQISIPEDLLGADDEVLRELSCPVPQVKLYEVLAKPMRMHSRILERDVHVYWDNVASTDFDAGEEYLRLLQVNGLLREPAGGGQIKDLDNAHGRRVWRSGVRYEALFQRKITHKLVTGDMIIQNNLTWAHSTANWTPNSGARKVVAAFA